MSITFYNTPQTNADRIAGSLKALGLSFDEVRLDLRAGEQKKPEYLAVNPNGKVPAIVLDGTPMFESVAIQIALGERYGVEKGLWPALGSPEHLMAITWIVWAQVSLAGAVFKYMANTSEWVPKDQHNEATAAAAMEESKEMMKILDDHLNGREYLTGSRFTLADLDISSVLGWALYMIKLDMAGYANVGAWLGRCKQHATSAAS